MLHFGNTTWLGSVIARRRTACGCLRERLNLGLPSTMHRDAKIGLALGILVIGFTAAFCFPRHDGAGGPALTEARTAQLDAAIQQASVKTYVPPGEVSPTGAGSTTAGAPGESATQVAVIPQPAAATAWRPIARKDDVPPAAQIAKTPASSVGGRAVATRTPAAAPAKAVTSADPTRPTAGVMRTVSRSRANGLDESASSESATHTVAYGETLTSIAQQHLGAGSRYEEIFEANRDQLRSPHDLRPGQVLRIPGSSVPSERPPLIASEQVDAPESAR